MVSIHLEGTQEEKQQATDTGRNTNQVSVLAENMVHYLPPHPHRHPQIPAASSQEPLWGDQPTGMFLEEGYLVGTVLAKTQKATSL